MADFLIIEEKNGRFLFIPQSEHCYNWSCAPKKMVERRFWNKVVRVADIFYVTPEHLDGIKKSITDAGFTLLKCVKLECC